MISGAINAIIIMPRRREKTVNFPSSIPGMFGWIAVHVHANRVAAQLQIMLHKDLLDERLLTSSVAILVPLRLGGEEWTNGMCNSDRIAAEGKRVIMKLRANVCAICSSL